MNQRETLSRNVRAIERHTAECAGCQQLLQESPSATERIDAACLSERQLDDEQVHGIIQGDEQDPR